MRDENGKEFDELYDEDALRDRERDRILAEDPGRITPEVAEELAGELTADRAKREIVLRENARRLGLRPNDTESDEYRRLRRFVTSARRADLGKAYLYQVNGTPEASYGETEDGGIGYTSPPMGETTLVLPGDEAPDDYVARWSFAEAYDVAEVQRARMRGEPIDYDRSILLRAPDMATEEGREAMAQLAEEEMRGSELDYQPEARDMILEAIRSGDPERLNRIEISSVVIRSPGQAQHGLTSTTEGTLQLGDLGTNLTTVSVWPADPPYPTVDPAKGLDAIPDGPYRRWTKPLSQILGEIVETRRGEILYGAHAPVLGLVRGRHFSKKEARNG